MSFLIIDFITIE